jgi:hypothetical protein
LKACHPDRLLYLHYKLERAEGIAREENTMNNQPALTNHHNTDISPINGTPTPEPHSTLARILESIHPTTRVGCAFHIMAGGELSRRGIILGETPNTFIVSYCDVFGMPSEMKTVSKRRTTSWKWFVDVEHSNVAYDKLFGVKIHHQAS